MRSDTSFKERGGGEGSVDDLPSDDRQRSLQAPVIDIVNHTNLPEQIWTKDVVPKKLPNDRRGPLKIISE